MTILNTNLADWYWVGSLGVYGSARGALVIDPSTDEAYLDWQGAGVNVRRATVWPSDSSGLQTMAALDEVLVSSGQKPTGLTPATQAQLLAYLGEKVIALLSASRAYTVPGVTGTISCDAYQSQGNLRDALMWGSASPAPTDPLPWLDNNWAQFSLTPAEAVAFANLVGAYKISVYAASFAATPQIQAGTITTTPQIDALTWPV